MRLRTHFGPGQVISTGGRCNLKSNEWYCTLYVLLWPEDTQCERLSSLLTTFTLGFSVTPTWHESYDKEKEYFQFFFMYWIKTGVPGMDRFSLLHPMWFSDFSHSTDLLFRFQFSDRDSPTHDILVSQEMTDKAFPPQSPLPHDASFYLRALHLIRKIGNGLLKLNESWNYWLPSSYIEWHWWVKIDGAEGQLPSFMSFWSILITVSHFVTSLLAGYVPLNWTAR